MIVLDATTKSLEAVLAGAIAANQLPIMASFVDVTTTTYAPGSSDGATNSTTGVTAVAAPAASTQRQVKLLSFFNADTAPATITVRLNNNGTLRTLHKVTLAIGSMLFYTDTGGFRVIDANGNVLGATGTGAAGGGAFTVISNTDTGAQNNWAPSGLSGNTLIEWSGAADLAVSGITGGITGQIVRVKNTGTKIATFAQQSGSSSAGKKFSNVALSAATPIFTGGIITYQYDGTDWQLVGHEQGAWITAPYASGNFTGNGSMTWTVDAGDVTTLAYRLSGRTLVMAFTIVTTTVGGTLNSDLKITIPGGFLAAKDLRPPIFVQDNATRLLGYALTSVGGSTLQCRRYDDNNWAAATNASQVLGSIEIEVQ